MKKLKEGKLRSILEFVRLADSINWIKATDIARGESGENYEAYERQPGEVRIYNPDQISWKELLIREGKFLSYESISAEGMNIWIPYFYLAKEDMYQGCPKCLSLNRGKSRIKNNTSGAKPE